MPICSINLIGGKEMPTFKHPVSGVEVSGMKLFSGDALQAEDVYASTDEWKKNPVGNTWIDSDRVLWVRPNTELSNEARELLTRLIRAGYCLAQRQGGEPRYGIGCYVVPCPDFNWDGRIAIPIVSEPRKTVVELVRFGFLKVKEVQITRPLDPIGGRNVNMVYIVTDEGKTFVT